VHVQNLNEHFLTLNVLSLSIHAQIGYKQLKLLQEI